MKMKKMDGGGWNGGVLDVVGARIGCVGSVVHPGGVWSDAGRGWGLVGSWRPCCCCCCCCAAVAFVVITAAAAGGEKMI